MSGIDWNKAPEGATHYVGELQAFCKMYDDALMISSLIIVRGEWLESVYKDIDDLSEEYDVIERPKHDEVDMNKQVFKVGDKVYYPQRGCGVYTIQQSEVELYPLLVEGATFTLSGRSLCLSANPQLIHATPENKAMLEQLYRTEFESLPVKMSGSDLTRAKLKEFGKPILCLVSDSSDEVAAQGSCVAVIVGCGQNTFETKSSCWWKYAVPCTGDEFLTGKDFE